MAHDPIQLTICITDVPNACYWKSNDGKVMLTMSVVERREPSERGTTHYATVFDKNNPVEADRKKYVGYGKFKPFNNQVNENELPPTADQLASGVVSDAEVDPPF